jgi:hypothetical protein
MPEGTAKIKNIVSKQNLKPGNDGCVRNTNADGRGLKEVVMTSRA